MGDFVPGQFCPREEGGYCVFAMYGQGCATIHGTCPGSQEEADALWDLLNVDATERVKAAKA